MMMMMMMMIMQWRYTVEIRHTKDLQNPDSSGEYKQQHPLTDMNGMGARLDLCIFMNMNLIEVKVRV